MDAFMFLHSQGFLSKRYLKPELKDNGHAALNIEPSGKMELLLSVPWSYPAVSYEQ